MGAVKRGRCACGSLACAAQMNAKNLTVASMCHAPLSYFARACLCFDVAIDDAVARSLPIARKIANHETLPPKKRTAGDDNFGRHGSHNMIIS